MSEASTLDYEVEVPDSRTGGMPYRSSPLGGVVLSVQGHTGMASVPEMAVLSVLAE